MKSWLALAAAAAVLAPQAAAAADADARCIVLMNAVAQNKAQAAQAQFAATAMIYYVGRVDGRGLSGQLKTLLEAESKTITQATASQEANNCGLKFRQRGDQLRAIGGGAPPAAAAPAAKAPAKK